jgi:hypothetical protein
MGDRAREALGRGLPGDNEEEAKAAAETKPPIQPAE